MAKMWTLWGKYTYNIEHTPMHFHLNKRSWPSFYFVGGKGNYYPWKWQFILPIVPYKGQRSKWKVLKVATNIDVHPEGHTRQRPRALYYWMFRWSKVRMSQLDKNVVPLSIKRKISFNDVQGWENEGYEMSESKNKTGEVQMIYVLCLW